MITYPIVHSSGEFSVFPDDRNCNLFYVIRTTPQLRRNQDNDPVFRATFWSGEKMSDETVSGMKGGMIRFDINLAINAEEEKKLKEDLIRLGIPKQRHKELRAEIDKRKQMFSYNPSYSDLMKKKLDEYEKKDKDKKDKNEYNYKVQKEEQGFLNAIVNADYSSIPEPATDASKISFGSILFTEGTVDLVQEKEGPLVKWHSGGGKPAMIGDNNSANFLSLTPEGAAVFYKMIKEKSFDSGIRFNLKFKMRLPALRIKIYASSEQTDYGWIDHIDKGCTGKINARDITQILTDMNFIKIDVEEGVGLPSDIVESIRSSMMDVVMKKVEDVIKTRIEQFTPEERQSKVQTIVAEEFRSFVGMDFFQEVVIDKEVSPQASVTDFFKGVSDEQFKSMVRLIDLSVQEFSWKRISVCANAPWDIVESVTVTCENENLPTSDKARRWSFLFKKDKPSVEKYDDLWIFRPPKTDNGKFKYKSVVHLKNGVNIPLPEQTAEGEYLMVNIGNVGDIDFTIMPHPNVQYLPSDLKPTSMKVKMRIQGLGSEGKNVSETYERQENDIDSGVTLKENIGMVVNQPIRYTVTYYFKELEPVTMLEQSAALSLSGATTVYADFPFKDRRFFEMDVPGSLTTDEKIKKIEGYIHYGDISYPFSFGADWSSIPMDLYNPKMKVTKFTYDFSLKYTDGRETLISAKQNVDKDTVNVTLPIKSFTVAGFKKLGIGTNYVCAELKITSSCGLTIDKLLWEDDCTDDRIVYYEVIPENQKRTLNWSLTLFDNDNKQLPAITGTTENALILLNVPK